MDLDFDEFRKGLWGEREPDTQNWVKWVHRNLSENHCPECLMLDGCLFAGDKHPQHPHHPHCHCVLENIPKSEVEEKAEAYAAYAKFDPYLFDPDNSYKHGKNKAFESWGYSISDSNWLKEEFERQALRKYISGDYKLGKLNKDGQRISIRIKLDRKDKSEKVSFVSGWMVYQNGKIQLTTPYGGK